jgi:hypothetical protein
MKNNLRKKNNFNGLTIKIIFHIRLEEPQENALEEPLAFPISNTNKLLTPIISLLDKYFFLLFKKFVSK